MATFSKEMSSEHRRFFLHQFVIEICHPDAGNTVVLAIDHDSLVLVYGWSTVIPLHPTYVDEILHSTDYFVASGLCFMPCLCSV